MAACLIIQDCKEGELSGRPARHLLAFCAGVLGVFEMLESLNGFGSPDKGGKFNKGNATFSGEIYEILQDAAPGSWSGEAAEIYCSKNWLQQECATKIADADGKIADILHNQEYRVELLRKDQAICEIAFSSAASMFTVCRFDVPCEVGGTILALRWLAQGGFGYAIVAIILLMHEAERNKERITFLRREYLDVIDVVKSGILSGVAAGGAPAVSAFAAPGFAACGGGLSGAVSRLDVAGPANGSADRPADVPYAYVLNPAAGRERQQGSRIPLRDRRAKQDRSKPNVTTMDMAARAADVGEAGQVPTTVHEPTPVPALAHRMGFA